MKTSPTGLALIKEFEGCRLKAYQCSAGVWTIGYGLTSAAGLVPVKPGLKITQEQADEYLAASLHKYEKAVEDTVKVPLTQNQFDALVSFCYNVGPGNFAKSSVARNCNKNNFSAVPASLSLWTKAGGRVLPGLVRRREAEAKLFSQN